MSIWILTFECNDYEQHGKYYIQAFSHKPSAVEVKEAFKYRRPVGIKQISEKVIEQLLEEEEYIYSDYVRFDLLEENGK